jgi:hypothetical protein
MPSGKQLMKLQFPRISALRILAVLMMCLPLVLVGEWAGVQYVKRRQHQEYVTDGLSKMRMAGLAVVMYTQDHDGRLPSADRWEEELRPYLPPDMKFTLKDVLGREPTRITMNRELSGKEWERMEGPGKVILFFEVPRRATGGAMTLDAMPTAHSTDGLLYCWADSHIYWRPIDQRDGFIKESREYMRVAAGR